MMRSASWGAVCGCLALTVVVGCSDANDPNECVSKGSEALSVCAKGATLKGVDVSVYQGTVNWSQVKSSGRAFAFARTSDGLNHPDTKFSQNWPAMKTAGIVRGVYQFFRPGQDPKAQAQMMLSAIDKAGGLQPGDLPPVLDIETADGQSAATIQARAKTWLQEVEKAVGAKPFVYTAAFMSSQIGSALSAYPLWVANYGPTCPTMPSGWSEWKFWQSADNGNVPGISGAVDLDQFDGTLAQLHGLALKAANPPPPSSSGSGATPAGTDVTPAEAAPNDGSQGATLGSGGTDAPPVSTTTAAPLDPCNQR
jgi:lysozyme